MWGSCRGLSHPTMAGQLLVDRPPAASTWSGRAPSQVLVTTHWQWLQKGGTKGKLPPSHAFAWCYARHVCWVFRVLCFPASQFVFGGILRNLRVLGHFFAHNC